MRICFRVARVSVAAALFALLVLAPERVFEPDDIAVAVLKLCDGARSVDDIAGDLAKEYNAPKQEIIADIVAMLQDLADKGVVTA